MRSARAPLGAATLIAGLILASSLAGSAHAARRLHAAVTVRDAATLLARGRFDVRLSGPRGRRLRVVITLVGTGTKRQGRRQLAAGIPASHSRHVTLRHGPGRVRLALTPTGRQLLSAALRSCQRLVVKIHLLGHRLHGHRYDTLGLPSRCPGGPSGPNPNAVGVRGAPFRVGAAVVQINPTYPVYLGGYGGGPAPGTVKRHINPLTGRPEDLAVRAVAIQSGGQVVEIAAVDTQGYFAGYQEGPYGITDIRNQIGGFLRSHGVAGASAANVLISALHIHAGPTLLGIWGPAQQQQQYLQQVANATRLALEQAFLNERPATITWGQTNAPWVSNLAIAQGNAFEGWPRDGSLGALWARDAETGRTIATYVTQPGYPNIVFGPGDLLKSDGSGTSIISSDFPEYAADYLQQRLGGIAVLTDGTLGNQTGPMQTDAVASPDLPPEEGLRQTRAFDDIIHMGQAIGNLTLQALGNGHRIDIGSLATSDTYLVTPVDNAALVALDESGPLFAPLNGGQLWATTVGASTGVYQTDRAFTPPYGQGNALLGTWVTSFRIGPLLFITMPGEFFPSIHDAWNRGIHGADAVFVIGAAQDFLGYEYPAYAFPFTLEGSDEHFFNPSIALGDQVVTAGEQEAQSLGFNADLTSSAELSATENNYARAVHTGVQVMPFPQTGDIDPATHSFTPVLEAFGDAARVNPSFPCGPINPGIPNCPLPRTPISDFHWDFGDGSVLDTAPQQYARAYFSPFVHHPFTAPGVYNVKVSTSSQGDTETASLPVTVYPALQVRIRRTRDAATAEVSGGSGSILGYRWTVDGRPAGYTNSIFATRDRGVSLAVTDSTGMVVQAGSGPG